jgi:hypothetical protein
MGVGDGGAAVGLCIDTAVCVGTRVDVWSQDLVDR